MKKRIQRKLEDIHQQPSHIRLQKAGKYTILAGAGIFFLWLFILLPIQLHVVAHSDPNAPGLIARLLGIGSKNTDQNNLAEQPQPSRSPQVGGIQDDIYKRPLPSGPFFKTASPGAPTPTPEVSSTPSATPLPTVASPTPSQSASLKTTPSINP